MLNQREDPDPEEIITDPDAGVQKCYGTYLTDPCPEVRNIDLNKLSPHLGIQVGNSGPVKTVQIYLGPDPNLVWIFTNETCLAVTNIRCSTPLFELGRCSIELAHY